MAELDGGQLLVQALQQEGVRYLFSLSGGHLFPIYNACLDAGIQIIDTRHEQAWGMIKHGQEITYGPERVCGCELGPVRYDRMVEGFGGHGEFVQEQGEIRPALERALASGKPACVNVPVDPTLPHPVSKFAAESGLF